jgi:hypothetical protein
MSAKGIEKVEKRSALKPLNIGWSYLHDFGIIHVSGWGDPFLVICERSFCDGESCGYNYWKLGVTFKTETEGFEFAENLDNEFGLPKIFSSSESSEFLLQLKSRFVNSDIKTVNETAE